MIKQILTSIFILHLILSTFGQTFNKVTSTLKPLSRESNLSIGDFNNDKKYDILISGSPDQLGTAVGLTIVYKNDGNLIFSELPNQNLQGVFQSSVNWADFNNDGLLDFLLSGWDNGPIFTQLYSNDGTGNFTKFDTTSFTQVAYSSADWGDVDNDGDLDIIIMGIEKTGARSTKLYLNDGNNFIEDTSNSFQGVDNGSVEFGDYDNDGDLDLLLTGVDGSDTRYTKIYNNQDAVFQEVSHSLDNVSEGESRWIDLESDGDLDIIISGFNGVEKITKIFINTQGDFTELTSVALPGVSSGAIDFGDLDNNGYVDILIGGFDVNLNKIFKIYMNDGNNNLSELPSAAFSNLSEGDIALADLDNDNDLDIVITGRDVFALTEIYRNDLDVGLTPNSIPTPPTTLSNSHNDTKIILNWDAGADNETPAIGLSYNIYLTFNADTIINSHSHLDGNRKIVDYGNVNTNLSYELNNPGSGDYTWSVQAIDNSFAGSAFALENTFHINFPPQITGQNDVTTPEDTEVEIVVNDLIISDPDNTFPDDFILTVLDGNNYSHNTNIITPNQEFNDTLKVNVVVFDGIDSSDVATFNVYVSPVNDIPVITGMAAPLTIPQDESLEITTDMVEVIDPDNTYPNDFSMTVLDSTNYSRIGNTITPDTDYIGDLTVPITVNDGQDTSDPFNLTVTVEKVTALVLEDFSNQVQIYPNPTSDIINLIIKSAEVGQMNIDIINLSGKAFKSWQLQKLQGDYYIEIEINDLPEGLYIIQLVQGNSKRAIGKILKK